MMPKYLIDVNLPYFFALWNTQDYIHQNDILNTAQIRKFGTTQKRKK